MGITTHNSFYSRVVGVECSKEGWLERRPRLLCVWQQVSEKGLFEISATERRGVGTNLFRASSSTPDNASVKPAFEYEDLT